MILAAGNGKRMLPLTNYVPKPLIPVAGKPLIIYHLESLSRVGITNIVINTGYMGSMIRDTLGNGKKWGVKISYSPEPYKPLGVISGIFNALPLLYPGPFILVNSDIWTDYPFFNLLKLNSNRGLSHLVLVDNPEHNLSGDFYLDNNKININETKNAKRLTFSGISLLQVSLFNNYDNNVNELGIILSRYINSNLISGEKYNGKWYDVGTPERLSKLDLIIS